MRTTVEPSVGGLARREWRNMVQRSRLPSSVKVTLLAHASMSRWHYHDDLANEHGLTRKRLAHAVGKDERSVQRHLRLAEAEGWLVRHRNGHRDPAQQSVFHYVTPSKTSRCLDAECQKWETQWETQSETQRESSVTPITGRQKCLPYRDTSGHYRDEISGAARCRPHHARWVGRTTASTDGMKGRPSSRPGHRLRLLAKLRAAVPAPHLVASPSGVRLLAGAMA